MGDHVARYRLSAAEIAGQTVPDRAVGQLVALPGDDRTCRGGGYRETADRRGRAVHGCRINHVRRTAAAVVFVMVGCRNGVTLGDLKYAVSLDKRVPAQVDGSGKQASGGTGFGEHNRLRSSLGRAADLDRNLSRPLQVLVRNRDLERLRAPVGPSVE